MVEDTKTLVAGAASSQEALAEAAQNAVKTISGLAEVVKLGAASIGADQPEAQVRQHKVMAIRGQYYLFLKYNKNCLSCSNSY